MRELTNPREIAEYKENLLEQRYNEQKSKNDYDYDEDGNIERCECGRYINSNGHCPRCDY